MAKRTIEQIVTEFPEADLSKVGYTSSELAKLFHLGTATVLDTCLNAGVNWIVPQTGEPGKPKRLWQVSVNEFFELRSKVKQGKQVEPDYEVSPYLSILLTPNWRVFMSYILVEHPMEFIELNVEISHHPDLIRKLNELLILTPNAGVEEKLAEIAAHCNILLDGLYDEYDLKGIATLCTKRLQEMRTGIIQVIN